MRRRAFGLTIACGVAWSALASPSWAGIVCPPIDIVPTSNVTGSLMPGDCTDPGDGSFVDLYRVTLPTDGFLTVSLSSASFDAFLSVVDEGFTTLIAGNDDGGPGSDSSISLHPISAGTYIIIANSFDAGETGPYTLATSFGTQGNPACAVQIALLPTAVADGTLSVDDCRLSQLGLDPIDTSFVDQYLVALPRGGPLTITLESSQFDAFLFILDETVTTVIDFNDDVSPSDLNSRLDLDLPSGTYAILANAIDPGGTGAYRLTLIPEPNLALLQLAALGAVATLARFRWARFHRYASVRTR